jgi:hypothetical protein
LEDLEEEGVDLIPSIYFGGKKIFPSCAIFFFFFTFTIRDKCSSNKFFD